jgi:hypothetical protein
MILDRRADVITAGLTSIRLVLAQPLVMLLWAATITFLVVLAMLPAFAGLLVVGPVVGHASWHAYCASVEPRFPAAGHSAGYTLGLTSVGTAGAFRYPRSARLADLRRPANPRRSNGFG